MSSDENGNQPKTIQYKGINFLNALKYIRVIEVSAIRNISDTSAVFDM